MPSASLSLVPFPHGTRRFAGHLPDQAQRLLVQAVPNMANRSGVLGGTDNSQCVVVLPRRMQFHA